MNARISKQLESPRDPNTPTGEMNMRNYRTYGLCFVTALLISTMAVAQEDVPDQKETGEAAYKIGCSMAASLNIPSCAELPSGRQFLNNQSLPPDQSTLQENSDTPDGQDSETDTDADGNSAQYPDAQTQYQQVLQNVTNLIQNYGQNIAPSPSASRKGNPTNQIPDCVLRHYACNK
jgi:hypothetical protein